MYISANLHKKSKLMSSEALSKKCFIMLNWYIFLLISLIETD